MTGVYHVDGHMVATDAQMMIDREGDYPKEYEGTSRDKRGNVIKGAYPPYKQIDGILRGFESGSGESMDVESFRGNVERAQEAQKALGKDAMVLVEIGCGRNARYVTAENAKKILDVYDALGEGATMESKRRASSVFTGILVKGAGTRAVLMTHPDNSSSIESSYVVRDGVVMLPEALGEVDVKRIDQSLRDKGLKPGKVAMLEYQKRIAGNPVFKRQEKGAPMNAEEAMDDLRELYRGNNYRLHNGAVAAMLRKACEDYIREVGYA